MHFLDISENEFDVEIPQSEGIEDPRTEDVEDNTGIRLANWQYNKMKGRSRYDCRTKTATFDCAWNKQVC